MFPKIISAIDIGTNSFHLLVARVTENSFTVVHREREVVRLRGRSEKEEHNVIPEKIHEAISVLTKFKIISDSFGAQIHAVATSALRDAKNRNEVLSQILESTGIEIKIISGEEEAEYIYKAVCFWNGVKTENSIIFDLGGGSTEFIFSNSGKVIQKKSVQLGAVRFSQKYFPEYIINELNITEFRRGVQNILLPIRQSLEGNIFENVIGIGGTITSICWLIEKNVFGREHHFEVLKDYSIGSEDFYKIRDIVLGKKDPHDRSEIPGLDKKRADIIPAGIIIIDELFKLFNVSEITAPGISLKEGIIVSTMK